jgi:hypothetical protein
MIGRTKELLRELEQARGQSAAGRHFLRSHLILKGINPDVHTETSEDDAVVVAELERMLAGRGKSTGAGPGRN